LGQFSRPDASDRLTYFCSGLAAKLFSRCLICARCGVQHEESLQYLACYFPQPTLWERLKSSKNSQPKCFAMREYVPRKPNRYAVGSTIV
jgi:hypothetical protein